MRHLPVLLLAMFLLARPNPSRANPLALDVPGDVASGQQLLVRWDALPNVVQEVELELSLDDGRWVRISPELAAGEGVFVWQVPDVVSAHARLRLRAGGDGFERELAVSAPFSIESHGLAIDTHAADMEWWHVGEHTNGQGWEARRPTASFGSEAQTGAAETGSRSPAAAPGRARTPAPPDAPRVRSAPGGPDLVAASNHRYPMRL